MIEAEKTSNLKKLGCALNVAVVMGLLLIALSALFYPKDNQKIFGMRDIEANGILGERANSIDVIFLGDSEAYSAFSPLQMWNDFGFTSYVCATSGQRLSYGNTLLRRATQNQRPCVVVIETNTAYRPTSPEDALKRAVEDVFPIFEYHDRWKSLSFDDVTSKVSTTYTDELKGFRIVKDVRRAKAKKHMAPSDEVAEIPFLNRCYLKIMVDYCRTIGAVPLFVSTPSTVNWNAARHNGMKGIARELDVAYLDLNVEPTKVEIDWKLDTKDAGDHMNLTGATKVSNYIGRYLSRFYKLPDHRKDKAYGVWNKCLARYKKKVV